MTDEEITKRLEELSYLKISPRDQEENKLLLLRGERCYEESTGQKRTIIERCMREFEIALDSRERDQIMDAADALRKCLEEQGEE